MEIRQGGRTRPSWIGLTGRPEGSKGLPDWYSWHVVELVQVDDTCYNGQIVTTNEVLAMFSNHPKPLHKSIPIPAETVKALMDSLKHQGIETLSAFNGMTSDTLPNGVIAMTLGVDGTTMMTEVASPGGYRFVSFWEPEHKRIHPQVVSAQAAYDIIRHLKSVLKLDKVFQDFQRSAPEGTMFLSGP